jgi:hypothetical protein
LSLAKLSVFCQHNEIADRERYGTLQTYKGCGDVCTCYAFELICLERDATATKFNLLSKSFDYSEDCYPSCICNSNPSLWATTGRLNEGGEALPLTPKIKLPSYDKLLESAQKKVSPNYARDIIGALADEAGPKNELVNH